MMINGMEGDEGAKTEGQSQRDNSTFFLEALETRNFMYSPPLPQLLMDYHNKSMTLLKNQSIHQTC